jgi:hypothetical protein
MIVSSRWTVARIVSMSATGVSLESIGRPSQIGTLLDEMPSGRNEVWFVRTVARVRTPGIIVVLDGDWIGTVHGSIDLTIGSMGSFPLLHVRRVAIVRMRGASVELGDGS